MAKLFIEYEEGVTKRTLIFRDKVYDFSMIPTEYGSKADKKSFEIQVENECYFDDKMYEALESLSIYSNEEDILEALEILDNYEEYNP